MFLAQRRHFQEKWAQTSNNWVVIGQSKDKNEKKLTKPESTHPRLRDHQCRSCYPAASSSILSHDCRLCIAKMRIDHSDRNFGSRTETHHITNKTQKCKPNANAVRMHGAQCRIGFSFHNSGHCSYRIWGKRLISGCFEITRLTSGMVELRTTRSGMPPR